MSRLVPILLLALLVLTVGAAWRGAEYDEGYTLLLTAGHRLPDWPQTAFTAATARSRLVGAWSMAGIARDLRMGDVHPPLYFWAAAWWRELMGPSLFALRMLSVLLGVGALALVGVIARGCAVPAMAAMLLTLGSYGFAYTSMVARGFALAQALSLAGVALLARSRRPSAPWARALDVAAGALLGAASFTNYLAAFVAGAGLLWAAWRGQWGAWAGVALFLPADLAFFLAQHDGRPGQFPPFALGPGMARLAKYEAADLFGGLPLYAGAAAPLVGALIAGLCLALLAAIAWPWRAGRWQAPRAPFASGALAAPLGLLALGAVFGNTPIELRYLAFSAPFVALLLAATLAGRRRGRWALAVVLAVQCVSVAGLLARPETMQPQAEAAREAAMLGGLALVPRGNDGVGIVVAFVTEAPDAQRLLVVPPADTAEAIRARVAGEHRAVLVLLGLDPDSRASLQAMRAAFDDPCWRPAEALAYAAAFDRVCSTAQGS